MRKKTENTDVVYEYHGDLFPKSNTLIDSKYKATLMEQKLLNIVLSKLQKRQYSDEGETGGLVCSMKAAELRELLGVSGGSFYTQLNKAAAAMTSRTIGFVNDDIKTFKYISLISMAQYEKGTFTVKFNYELKKYLTQEAPFTVLDLPVILSYNSVYSLRLHEILLSECYNMKKPGVAKYTKKEATKGHYKIEMGLSELKLSLGVVNAETSAVQKVLAGSSTPDYDKAVEKATEKSFSDWYEFRRKVIGNIGISTHINFTGNLSKKIYRTKRELNYDYWGGYYYYSDNKIPAGYTWCDVSLTSFTLYINNTGVMHGKLNALFSRLSDKFKTFGTVIEEYEYFIRLKLNNTSAVIVQKGDFVMISWGKTD